MCEHRDPGRTETGRKPDRNRTETGRTISKSYSRETIIAFFSSSFEGIIDCLISVAGCCEINYPNLYALFTAADPTKCPDISFNIPQECTFDAGVYKLYNRSDPDQYHFEQSKFP